LDQMEPEALRELRNRLDHIEAYLERLGSTTSYPYARYGAGTGGMTSLDSVSFDSGPASFGSVTGFSDMRASTGPSEVAGQPVVPPGMINGVPADIMQLAVTRKIEAIKLYRERTGVGLKEAKDAIDRALGG
jgi:Ribosomal protein L7/L12 C-terminal domain